MIANEASNIFIEVRDDLGFLGCMLIDGDFIKKNSKNYVPYSAIFYDWALNWIKWWIVNLNKNLIAHKDKVPRAIFALRFLEELEIEGDKDVCVPVRTDNTEDMLEPYRDDYELDNPNVNFEAYTISIDKNDAKELCKDAYLRIYVDLEKNRILANGFFNTITLEDYQAKKEIPNIFDVKTMRDKMKDPPDSTWMSSFPFNAIEEVIDCIEENKDGFKSRIGMNNILVII